MLLRWHTICGAAGGREGHFGQPEPTAALVLDPQRSPASPRTTPAIPDLACRRAALVTTAAVPPWAWALIGLVVGIPACAQLNCYIERKREECEKR